MPVPWYGFCFVFFVLFFLFFSFPSCSYSRFFCAIARSRAYLDGVVEGGAEKHSRTTHDVDGIETLRNTGADQTLHGELRRRRGEEERGKYASIAVSVSFSLAPTRRTPKKKRKKKSRRERVTHLVWSPAAGRIALRSHLPLGGRGLARHVRLRRQVVDHRGDGAHGGRDAPLIPVLRAQKEEAE